MKPKMLLIGYRAYGDFLYALPSISQFFDGYEVHLETNPKGYELFHDDPRFASVTVFDVYQYPQEQWERIVRERWKSIVEEMQPDKIINLWRTLETACIAERYQEEFALPVGERQKIFGDKIFYDAVAKKCGVEVGALDGLYFTEDQKSWGERWREREAGSFIVLMVVAGSCSQKIYPDLPSLARGLVEKYDKMKIYMMGDESTKSLSFGHDRIKNISGQSAIKQSIFMTKHADFVFGGETGLLVAAGMFGTPKMMLCTSSSIKQACSYHENDFSIQSEVPCSPCHRAVYCNLDCENTKEVEDGWEPACIAGFDHKQIFDTIGAQYDELLHMQ
jgi:ADP-heptose:LPS heptosyltransferase